MRIMFCILTYVHVDNFENTPAEFALNDFSYIGTVSFFFGGGNRSTKEKTSHLAQVTAKFDHRKLHPVNLVMSGIRSHNV